MNTIDSKVAVLQLHQIDENINLEGNGPDHGGMKISPPMGQFDRSDGTI
jgi:hypothetical protein